MKRPSMVRDRILTRMVDALQHLCLQISMYNPDELEVLRAIERPQQFAVAEDLTNYLMERLGHATAPKDKRFDKTHRAMTRKKGKGPRGLKLAGEPTDAEAPPLDLTR